MTYIYTVASLNINGIANDSRIRMLEYFLWTNDIDIAVLQEVTGPHLVSIRRYTKHANIGTERRGTAILTKDGLILTDVRCLPSGRGIAAMYNGTCRVNLYAPSGAGRKEEREGFYNVDVPYLLPATQTGVILAGDFNCLLSHSDTTGQRNYSRAIDNLMTGLYLYDIVGTTSTRPMFTHYTPTGTSRLDRIYISPKLQWKKQRVETIVAAFTDHLAMESSYPIPMYGGGLWRMNTTLLDGAGFRQLLQGKWGFWRTQKKYYPTTMM